MSIDTLLKTKTVRERHLIKSEEVVNKFVKGNYEFSGIEIGVESVSMKDDNLVIMARAWENGVQLGFGEDGSIDIERFVFVNPPVLVNDPSGNIIRESIDELTGQKTQRKLREDIVLAIGESLAHTIKVSKREGQIVPGKIGNTTLTVYPDADPETTTVDGVVYTNGGADDTFSNLRTAAGTVANDTTANSLFAYIGASTTSNQYSLLGRSIFLFDTSSIGAGATISSATWSGYGTSTQDNLNGASSANSVLVLVASTPASNTALAAADYGQLGTTDFGRSVTQENWSTVAYNDTTINASGIAAINKTGVTKFGIRYGWDFDNTTTGLTWASSGIQKVYGYFADQTGTANDPKLVVNYSSSSIKDIIQMGGILFPR